MNYKIPISKEDFEQTYHSEGKKLASQSEKKNKILKELQEVKELTSKKIDDYANEAFKYDYLELDNTTDEQLEKLAREGVLANKEQAEKALNESNAEKKDALNERSNAKKIQVEKENAQTESRYEDAKKEANNQTIKRGIGRSSIIMNLLKDYDLSKLSQINANNENYKQEAEKIQAEIDRLDQDLKQSLKELDMKSAIEINERLDELKAERDKANEKVIKYNNEVTETLNKNKLEYMNSPALKEAMEMDNAKSTSLKKSITYDLLDYYSQLSYEDALKDYKEGNYEEYLDENQIRIIKNYLQQRM